jgi:hypothetical protein
MVNSIDAAISVRDASSLAAGGVSILPGTAEGGVGISPDAWAVTQGGVRISPGLQARPYVAIRNVNTTAVPSLFRFFKVFSLGHRMVMRFSWK